MEKSGFKLWLLDEAVASLIEAVRSGIDMIDAMEFSTDREFSKLLGVPFKWTRFVVGIAMSLARNYAGGAQFEDIITDVISGLYQDINKGGSLANSIAMAKTNSTTPEELLNNMKGVMTQATRFRVMKQRTSLGRHRAKATAFSQMDPEEGGQAVNTVRAHGEKPSDRMDSDSLGNLVVNELKKMYEEAINSNKTRRASRLEMAIKIAPDRIAGMSLDELLAKHQLKQTQMFSILEDIQEALGRVAGRLGDDRLLHGVERFKKKGI